MFLKVELFACQKRFNFVIFFFMVFNLWFYKVIKIATNLDLNQYYALLKIPG